MAHPECDEEALLVALLRGAFEFQGQKCSAASRAYIPSTVWSRISSKFSDEVSKNQDGGRTGLHELHDRSDRPASL